jgi:hypothetical protein
MHILDRIPHFKSGSRRRPSMTETHQRHAIAGLLRRLSNPHILSVTKGTEMKRRKYPARIGNFLDVLRCAAAAASATESGRQPRARDLRVLGIDPEQFRRIGN